MSKITKPTKSFIILFLLALFGVVLSINLWSELSSQDYGPTVQVLYDNADAQKKAATNQQSVAPLVDTSKWKTYSNPQFSFKFKYAPDWKISQPKKANDFYIISIDPGTKYYNIKIYVSTKGYYVMAGLPVSQTKIGGQPALNVNDLLFGVKNNSYYYTFDVGLSLSLKNNFDALVRSVTFGN